LPTAAQLYSQASDTVLFLSNDRTVVDCTTNLPDWLPGLLGVSSSSPTATPTDTPAVTPSATPGTAATPSATPTVGLPL